MHTLSGTTDAMTAYTAFQSAEPCWLEHTITCLSDHGKDQVIAYLTSLTLAPTTKYIYQGCAHYDVSWFGGPAVDEVRKNAPQHSTIQRVTGIDGKTYLY